MFGPFLELDQRWKGAMALLELSRISAQTSSARAFWGIGKVKRWVSISLVGILFLDWIRGLKMT